MKEWHSWKGVTVARPCNTSHVDHRPFHLWSAQHYDHLDALQEWAGKICGQRGATRFFTPYIYILSLVIEGTSVMWLVDVRQVVKW